jgi:hypothetical protein
MAEPEDTPPRMKTIPQAQRGTDETAGGADSSPHETEPELRPQEPHEEDRPARRGEGQPPGLSRR